MRQVIITVRDSKGITRRKEYFTSYEQYVYYASDYIKDTLLNGCEFELKIGKDYKSIIDERELAENAKENNTSVTQEIDSFICLNEYYVRRYLIHKELV